MTEPDKTRQESGLTQKQYNAIDAILAGATDEEAAKRCGVSRQTVNGWKNNDPEFMAELNQRRELLREMHFAKLQSVIGKALQVLADELDSDFRMWRRDAAFYVLKTAGIYIKNASPKSPN